MIKALKVVGIVAAVPAAVALGLVLGTAAGVAADGDVDFPVDDQGRTFGSGMDVDPWNAPDLVLAIGRDESGEMIEGYVLKTDLEGPSGMTPEEAVAWTEANGDRDIEIPLYDKSGQIVIGIFVLSGGGVSYTTPDGTTVTPGE